MPQRSLLVLLEGGDRRSTGRSDEVAAIVSGDRGLFPELIAGLWSENPIVRMRAADAAEKVTRGNREVLSPYKDDLLALMADTKQREVRWHLAVIVPRMPLNGEERLFVESVLNKYLEDRSSIVKTFALQGLADLAKDDPGTRSRVLEALRQSCRSGTAAMKARSRKLLLRLEDI